MSWKNIEKGVAEMNYLKQILAFNQRQLLNPLSQGQYTLWHALMSVNNECAWQEWFTVANLRLELFTGLSRQGIDKARNTLKQLGFIDYKSNGTKATSYKITKLYDDSLQDSLQDSSAEVYKEVADEFTKEEQTSLRKGRTLNKQNKTKLNKTKVNNAAAANARTNAFEFYQANFGILNSHINEDLQYWIQDLGDELVIEALSRALEQGAQYSYAKSIMRDWTNKGIHTLEQAKAEQLQYSRKRKSKANKGKVEILPDWVNDPTTGQIKPSGVTFNPDELFGGGTS